MIKTLRFFTLAFIGSMLLCTVTFAKTVTMSTLLFSLDYPIGPKGSTVNIPNPLPFITLRGNCQLIAVSGEGDETANLSAIVKTGTVEFMGETLAKNDSLNRSVPLNTDFEIAAYSGSEISITNHSDYDLVAKCSTI